MRTDAMLTAYKTIVTREIRRFMRIWPQTLLPPAVTMTLYFIIFGNLIGSRIGVMGGFDYMAFIVPGLIMMSVITKSIPPSAARTRDNASSPEAASSTR